MEICAGAGGQSLGLELAGFEHELSVELDPNAGATLRHNRPHWKVAAGRRGQPCVWDPAGYVGVDLLAGGVPCPPFTIAGRQLGATDERDLFAWAIELCGTVQPRALLLENVRGLSLPRFAAYRQHVLDRLADHGYAADWRLLQASDYGVPQLRPRFVLVAMRPDDFPYFTWPEPHGDRRTVGDTLLDLMAKNGWPGAAAWAAKANDIAPTIVGGSKKHGGADLGPTRAKRAWRESRWTRLAWPTQRHRPTTRRPCCPSSPARWSPGSRAGTAPSTAGSSPAGRPRTTARSAMPSRHRSLVPSGTRSGAPWTMKGTPRRAGRAVQPPPTTPSTRCSVTTAASSPWTRSFVVSPHPWRSRRSSAT